MTFEDLYARTVLRREWRVCGEVLLPLTLGHCRILDALPAWNPGTWVDLLISIWVCARPARGFRMPRGLRERLAWRVRLWRLKRFHSLELHKHAWHRYVRHHMTTPVVTWRGKGGRPGSPVMAGMRAALIGIGYDPRTVDDAPIDEALADYYASAESEGRLTVTGRSQDDLEEESRMAEAYVLALGKN